jgi:hypothetical protein
MIISSKKKMSLASAIKCLSDKYGEKHVQNLILKLLKKEDDPKGKSEYTKFLT